MLLNDELIDYTERVKLLKEFLDSDDILNMSLVEIGLLENMQKGLEAYCTILSIKIEREVSIIKLKDERD